MKRLALLFWLLPTVVVAQAPTVTITGDGALTVVSVGTQGPAGPSGPQGPIGPAFTGGTVTTPIVAADGEAAAPSFTFTNWPLSGMYTGVGGVPIIGANRGGGIPACLLDDRMLGTCAYAGRVVVFSNVPGILPPTLDLNGQARIDSDTAAVLNFKNDSTASAPTSSRLWAGNGGYMEWGSASEEVTLDTGNPTTDTAANLLPPNSILLGVATRVTEAITVCANFSVGDSVTPARFVSASPGVALDSTTAGLIQQQGNSTTQATGPTQSTAAKVRITCNVNPGAGKIRVQTYFMRLNPPTT